MLCEVTTALLCADQHTLLTGVPCTTGYDSIDFPQQFSRPVSSNGLVEAPAMLLLCSVQQAMHFYLSEKSVSIS